MKKYLLVLWLIGYICSIISYVLKGNKKKFIIRTIVYGLLMGLIIVVEVGE